jgi:hypothetical protein
LIALLLEVQGSAPRSAWVVGDVKQRRTGASDD